MADTLVSRHIPALFNGVSQQSPTLRQDAQAETQVNAYATVMDGLRKRPPFQHIAKVTTADISTAFVHAINRDVGERYIVIITDGDLKVYDANTGVEKTVNFPTGKAYLDIIGGGDAEASFAADSIADYSFIVNKTVVITTKVAPTSTPANYNDWYQPDIWGVQTASRYFNPNGAGSLTGTVNTFSDLPKAGDPSPPSNGDIYKVEGFDENNFGGYYVLRSGGVWNEHYGPGANISMDEVKMPHALIREADGTFTFTPFAYQARQFGDANTNPPPTFTGRTINGVFYWKNRLGFITDENIVFSGAGDYGNFFRNTLTTLLDSDVVDVATTTNKVTILQYAVAFNKSMMLFADQSQFSLTVRDVLTPTSVSLDEATGYEMDLGVRPVSIGTEVYFISKSGSYSRVREYFVHPESLNTSAADVTAHAQRFVPSGVFKLAGNDIEDVLFAISNKTGERNRIYNYKFFWSGDEKVQSAWSYWELGDDDIILSIDVIENTLYALIKRSDGTYLEKADIDVNATNTGIDFDILLDRRFEAQPGNMSYAVGPDVTTITLPYDTTEEDDMKVILTSGSGKIGQLVDPDDYVFPVAPGDTIEVPGDVTGNKPVVGVNYEMLYEFSEQFVKDSRGNADTTGRLQLRTFTITYQDSAFFQVKVWPYGKGFSPDVESVVPASLDAFTGRMLGEPSLITGEATFHTGSYQFYIDGNSRDVKIQLLNPSHLQARFHSVEWEGMFTKRTRSA